MSSQIKEAETFEASSTFAVQCSSLRKGGFVMVRSRPCRIVDMVTSKTGKHGHAKVLLVVLDIFTDKKMDLMAPARANLLVPVVKKNDLLLVGIDSEGFLSLLDMENGGVLRQDVRCPETPVGDF